ncbi:hypothetical protein KNT64_gp078 [Pseudomonas phage PspYZU05]|uniref:Lipoprotein n=1 Tax=Pseudomonas phage PspYZU05 TaxID=1983556 RepID=A0A2U7N2F5_9CAUD|nr:hypothetical protein KNT64_gp078 [Pseudomonas phage PspYZU05]ASD52030.1 hypothetical protein PspYZU05_78 [Pseudomonas phage PspYZU05]
MKLLKSALLAVSMLFLTACQLTQSPLYQQRTNDPMVTQVIQYVQKLDSEMKPHCQSQPVLGALLGAKTDNSCVDTYVEYYTRNNDIGLPAPYNDLKSHMFNEHLEGRIGAPMFNQSQIDFIIMAQENREKGLARQQRIDNAEQNGIKAFHKEKSEQRQAAYTRCFNTLTMVMEIADRESNTHLIRGEYAEYKALQNRILELEKVQHKKAEECAPKETHYVKWLERNTEASWIKEYKERAASY